MSTLSATLLLDASILDEPYAFYRRLVAEAPVWCVPDTEIVTVSSYDAVTEVVGRVDDFSSNLHSILYRSTLGTPALFPLEPGGLQTLAIADPPVHAVHRGTVFPELVARRMAALRTDIEALAEERLATALSRVITHLTNPAARIRVRGTHGAVFSHQWTRPSPTACRASWTKESDASRCKPRREDC